MPRARPTVHQLCRNPTFSIHSSYLLAKSRFPDLLETLVVRSNRWSGWSRVACAQGRRATRLRYAPTYIALLNSKAPPNITPNPQLSLTPDCARMGYCTAAVQIGAARDR